MAFFAKSRKLTAKARRAQIKARRGSTAIPVFPILVAAPVETKFHDVNLVDASISQSGTITASINLIAQGTGESQRVGRKITITQINWRFDILLSPSTAAAATSETVRVIMFQDKQANGAGIGTTDLLETDNYQSFNNLANRKRFRTLFDRYYDMNALAGGGDGTTEDYGEMILTDSLYKKVNIPLEFDSTAGVITELTSNNIGVLLMSKAGAITAFNSKIRLRFTDI